MAVIELITGVSAFYKATGAVFRANNPRTTDTKDNRMKEALVRLPNARVTWICALFLLGYVGVEVALGGWIVKFMLEVRDGAQFASGMTATGFWMGITVGRIVLGFVTPKLGEKLAIAVSPAYILYHIHCLLILEKSLLHLYTHNHHRYTSLLQWPSNSSSGSSHPSTSPQSRSPSKDSSWGLYSPPPSLPPPNFCLVIST